MSSDMAAHYLEEIQRQFRGYKHMAEGAIAQLKDEELFVALDKEANSVAIIIKHLAGNMRSRFVDFSPLMAKSQTGTATRSSK